MASVDIQKMTTGMMAGRNRHYGKEEREAMRHSNTDIDKGLSHLNYDYGTKDYAEAIQRYKEKIEQIDAISPPKRVTRDRITGYSLLIPCPKEIERAGKSDLFFDKTWEFLERWMPEGSLVHGQVHKDEVHKYYDSHKQEWVESCEHMHVEGIAYAEWKDKKGNERKGINGKNFFDRDKLYRRLNKDFAKMVFEEFGIEFNTKEGAYRETVEALKAESKIAEYQYQTQKAEQEMVQAKSEVQAYKDEAEFVQMDMTASINVAKNAKKAKEETEKELAELQKQREELSRKNADMSRQYQAMQQKISSAEEQCRRLGGYVSYLQDKIMQLETAVDELTHDVNATVQDKMQAKKDLREAKKQLTSAKHELANLEDSLPRRQDTPSNKKISKGVDAIGKGVGSTARMVVDAIDESMDDYER